MINTAEKIYKRWLRFMVAEGPDRRDGLYHRLGVAPEASREDIVHAYRRLAHGAHPDAHPDDPDASRRFHEITEAYEILTDPQRRGRYDKARDRGVSQHGELRVRVPGAVSTQGGSGRAVDAERFVIDLGSMPSVTSPLMAGPVHVAPAVTAQSSAPSPGQDLVVEDLGRLLDRVFGSRPGWWW
jgi:DnaJ-class molecular chaperone